MTNIRLGHNFGKEEDRFNIFNELGHHKTRQDIYIAVS